MVRIRDGEKPARKKKSAKKTGKSLLERAAAKKRTKVAASTMAPTKVARSSNKRMATDIVRTKRGEHPVDALANSRSKSREKGGKTHRSPIDEERSKFRLGPLSDEIIADVCRMLRYSLHREVVERLLGLSRGKIKRWIRRGKESREKLEAWHEEHDDLVQAGSSSEAAQEQLGAAPEFDIFATFHACVLVAESEGERLAVGGIVNAAIGAGGCPPDWKANAWLLSRRYNKRWGSYAERSLTEEEDLVDGTEANQRSAVDRLADTLDEMFGRGRAVPED